MTILWENPLPIWLGGAVLATLAGVVFLTRRNLASLMALAAVLALTVLLALVERMVVTPREEVEAAVAGVLDAIEANELSTVLTFVDQAAAEIRADAEAGMKELDVDKANIEGALAVELSPGSGPPRATAKFRGILLAKSRRGGATVGFRDQVEIDWVKRGDTWLVENYRVFDNGRPIDARRRKR